MNRVLKYNIRLSIKVLKELFNYFDMNESNTIIELVTRNEKVIKEIDEYKDNIICIKDNKNYKSIFLKNMNFSKLFYFLSKNTVYNIYYYKVGKKYDINKISHKLKDNNIEASIYTRIDTIYEICFNDEKFDLNKTKETFKVYKSINIEYIVLFIMLIIGLIILIKRRI